MQLLTKLFTLLLLIQQYVLINTIYPSQPMTTQQAVAVLQVSDWDESLHDEALAIMQCESEMIPIAMGDYSYGKPYALGLAQIHASYNDNWTCDDIENDFIGYYPFFHCTEGFTGSMFDAVDNMILARLIYERNGNFNMWSCSKVLN